MEAVEDGNSNDPFTVEDGEKRKDLALRPSENLAALNGLRRAVSLGLGLASAVRRLPGAMDPEGEAYVETEGEDPIIDPEEERMRHFMRQQQSAPQPTGLQFVLYVIFSLNPWWYVAALAALWWLHRRLRPHLDERLSHWRDTREAAAEAAAIKKNPDLYRARMEAIEAHRRSLQERYDQQAAEAAERARVMEEQKRKEKTEELARLMEGKGYRNKRKVDEAEWTDGVNRASASGGASTNRRALRPDYNPLMGSGGGGGGYRPSRRNVGGGGG